MAPRPGQAFLLTVAIGVAGHGCGGNPTVPSKPMPTEQGHRLTGLVTEAVGLPVLGAKVTVGPGTPGERSTTTATNGLYILIGLTGSQTVVVSADGYASVTGQVSLDRDAVFNAEIRPVAPAANISGEWRVTFQATGSCPDLPAALLTRTYRASVTQEGARMTVDFSGAAFDGSTHFDGFVRGTQVAFALGDWDHQGIIERISDTQMLALWGNVTAAAGASSIKGKFDGGFYLNEKSGGSTQGWGCESASHLVTFQR